MSVYNTQEIMEILPHRHPFLLIDTIEELQRVLPEGTRLIDSGAAIARRTAWLLEHEAPDAKSSDENKAFCMALTAETEQLLPVLHRYGFPTLEKLPL